MSAIPKRGACLCYISKQGVGGDTTHDGTIQSVRWRRDCIVQSVPTFYFLQSNV